jgi:hypothetical protein
MHLNWQFENLSLNYFIHCVHIIGRWWGEGRGAEPKTWSWACSLSSITFSNERENTTRDFTSLSNWKIMSFLKKLIFLFLVVLGFGLRVSCLLGRRCIAWATLLALFSYFLHVTSFDNLTAHCNDLLN